MSETPEPPRVFVSRALPGVGPARGSPLERLARESSCEIWPGPGAPSREDLARGAAGCEGLLCLLTDVIDRDSEQMQSQMALGLLLFANGRLGPSIRQHLVAVSTLNARKSPMHQRGVLVRAVQDFDDYLGETGAMGAVEGGETARQAEASLADLMTSADLDRDVVARSLREFLSVALADAEARYQDEWRPSVEPLLNRAAEG